MKRFLKRSLMGMIIICLAVFIVWLAFFITDQITLKQSIALNRYGGETVFGYEEGNLKRDLSKQEAVDDLKWFKDVALEVHLKLQDAQEKENFFAAYETVLKDISDQATLSVAQFSMHLSKLAASIGDAHTYVRYLRGIHSEEAILRLPLEFKALSDGFVVSSLYKDYCTEDYENIERGMAVLSVNGKKLNEYKEEVYPYFSAENDEWRDYMVSYYLPYAYFNNYFTEAGDKDSIQLTLRNAEGEQYTYELLYVDIKQNELIEKKRDDYGYRLTDDGKTAIFWLDTCDYTDDYLNAVDDFFKEVKNKGIQKVVVDIRENTGGSSMVVWPFLQYLGVTKTKDFDASIQYSGITIKRRHITMMNRFLRTLRKITSFGNLYLEKAPYTKNIFDGDLYVMVSGKTFSSGNFFAVMLSDNKLAKTVGTPTGNEPSAYGDPIIFTCKNSRLQFYISYKRFIRPNQSKDPALTLTPDVMIPYSVTDFQKEEDPQLDWIYQQP
ncbi:MAG TPA: S41 family peptidase [Thermotogota bacterium]|nr:S41 family peptidase [Thermotogota bacterium]HRW35359.1 S41 family peptidase [Thermotogota bacterium]